MAVATALGAAALMGGIGLTVSSAWLITMAAQHPPILVLGVSIVMVRFFGISRSAARYAERIVSHETVFRRLTSLRVNLYQKLAARVTQLAHDLHSGNFVKAIVDDVERAQEYQLRVVLPRYAAFVSIGFGIIVSLWIFPLTLIFILPGSLIFLLLCVLQGFDGQVVAVLSRDAFQSKFATLAKLPMAKRAAAALAVFNDYKIPEAERDAWLEPLLEA